MNDVECPYCEKEFEVCQDDGHATEDGSIYDQECPHCEKHFALVPSIHWSFSASKAKCMNDGPHNFREDKTPATWNVGKPLCIDCGERVVVDKESHLAAMAEYCKTIDLKRGR